MNVLVQHLDSGLYLAPEANWVNLQQCPLVFRNAVEAITYCIRHSLRKVRLVSNAGLAERETYLYPFGEDPGIKAERKKLRRSLAASRRLKQDQRMLQVRMDMLVAQTKESKKQIPFNRNHVALE